MKKKSRIISALFILASVAAVVCLILFKTKDRGFEEIKIDRGEASRIESSRVDLTARGSGALGEVSVLFNGHAIFCDRSGLTYYYSLPENSSSAYRPDVEVKSDANDVKIALLDDITDGHIAASEPLEAILYNEEAYQKIRIVCTALPIISIDTKGAIGEEYVGMTMRVFDSRADASHRVLNCDGKIRVSEITRADSDRQSYRIEASEISLGGNTREYKIGLLGMRKDGDWILCSDSGDGGKIRGVFQTDPNGTDGVPGYRLCELILNGEHVGLYALGHPAG